jgi:hypothetical protein
MRELIIELESKLADLKKAYIKEEKLRYEQKPHKDFNAGDLVFNGDSIGMVEWTENKDQGISYEQGYMCIDNDPFRPRNELLRLETVKRDKWDKIDDPYYTRIYKVNLSLTGLEIERLKRSIKSISTSKGRINQLMEFLDSFRNNESKS